jgi:hypothetical protein
MVAVFCRFVLAVLHFSVHCFGSYTFLMLTFSVCFHFLPVEYCTDPVVYRFSHLSVFVWKKHELFARSDGHIITCRDSFVKSVVYSSSSCCVLKVFPLLFPKLGIITATFYDRTFLRMLRACCSPSRGIL